MTARIFSDRGGFTIAELLIAAIIAMFALAAGFELVINQNKNHIIQAGVSDMQQNARVSIDELVAKIRQAGYLVPPGVPALQSWDTNPDTIAICFLKEPLCTASLSDPMPQPSAELKLVGCDLSCFEENVWAFIYDPNTKTGEFFFITQVQVASAHIQHNLAQLSKSYPANSRVFMMEYFKYWADVTTDTLHPRMMMMRNLQPEVIYADNIEDLQFQYTMTSGAVQDEITIAGAHLVREVAIQVVGRTDKSDLFMNDYRRDTLESTVMVRNLEL